MSTDNTEAITNTLYGRIFPWVLTALLSMNAYFITSWMNDQNEVMHNVEELKSEVREIRTTLQILKEYDLKKKN
jgi:hypothetical protein